MRDLSRRRKLPENTYYTRINSQCVGFAVGDDVGSAVGDDEGEGLGNFVGCNVGLLDGTSEGAENGKRENRGHTL